jgi:hypothetical protein
VTDNFITKEINYLYRTTMLEEDYINPTMDGILSYISNSYVIYIEIQYWRIGSISYMRYLLEDVKE